MTLSSDRSEEDKLFIESSGNSTGQIRYDDATKSVFYSGNKIGELVSDGLNRALTINLTTDAANDNAALTALAKAIRYQLVTDAPASNTVYNLQFDLKDSGNNSVISTYQLGVAPQNDAIGGTTTVSSATYKETDFRNSYGNPLPLQVFGGDTFELTDPDKSYDGVKLVVRTSLTGDSALQDQLSIPQNAAFISLNENNVYYMSTKFAEIKNNNSSSVELVFNSNATDEMINHLKWAISYCNTSFSPTLSRNIVLDFYGPSGTLEKSVSKTINVNAVDSAPTATNIDYNVDANLSWQVIDLKTFNDRFIDQDGDSFYGIKITNLKESGYLKLNTSSVILNQVITAYDISQGKLKYYLPGNLPVLNPNYSDYFNFSFKVISKTTAASYIDNSTSLSPAATQVESKNAYKFQINLVNDLPVISADSESLSFAGQDRSYYSLNFCLHITDLSRDFQAKLN